MTEGVSWGLFGWGDFPRGGRSSFMAEMHGECAAGESVGVSLQIPKHCRITSPVRRAELIIDQMLHVALFLMDRIPCKFVRFQITLLRAFFTKTCTTIHVYHIHFID